MDTWWIYDGEPMYTGPSDKKLGLRHNVLWVSSKGLIPVWRLKTEHIENILKYDLEEQARDILTAELNARKRPVN